MLKFIFKTFFIFGLMTSSALAGKLIFDARIDGQSQTYNEAANSAGLGNSNFRYLVRTARLDYSTAFNERTSVRGRLILNTNQGNVNTRDSMNNFVDLFFINHKVTDHLDLTAGKFSSEMGGWEHQITSADVYLFSNAYSGGLSDLNTQTKAIYNAQTGQTISTFSWANTGTTRYYTGVKFTQKWDDQEMALHSADLTADDNTGATSSQTRTLTGLVYKGSFADKFVQPILSYHEGHLPGFTSDSKAKFMTAGLRFNCDEHIIDADYIQNLFEARTTPSGGGAKDDSITSALLGWKKTFGLWTPQIKVESSVMKAAETKIYDVLGYGLALEYRPVAEESFRYHLAYNSKEYSPASGDKMNLQEIIFGARIGADILK